MTSTVVAVRVALPDGKPDVIGYGFNSNGRYSAKSLMDERFIPRLLEASPESLIDEEGFLCPFECWDKMMTNEKPGGHGERSVAVGTLDMALWDALSKAKGVPLFRLISDRYNGGKCDESVSVYAAGVVCSLTSSEPPHSCYDFFQADIISPERALRASGRKCKVILIEATRMSR